MNDQNLKARKGEQGFTLVELAVVMIIIGLLIGGILKGQELITNARVTATATQLQSMSAAVNGFRDAYNAVPGDMVNATTRIPNCTAVPCFDGSGDGIVNRGPGWADAAAADGAAGEGSNFFIHLARSNFITGVDASAVGPAIGVTHPAAPIGGAFHVGDTTINAGSAGFSTAGPGGAAMPGGLWIVAGYGMTGQVGTANNFLLMDAVSAVRIDRKLDDGSPSTGSVIGSAGTGGDLCRLNATAYNEQSTISKCAIAYALR